MELRWLETFVAVVDHEGFARAADALYCSQPTVSSHIKSLEIAVRAELFERTRRPVELTQAGKALLPHARELLRGVEAARHGVESVLGLQTGSVTLGTYGSATAAFLPELLRRFRAAYPGVVVHLREGVSVALADAAQQRELELFLYPGYPTLPESTYEGYPLWREWVRIVVPEDHPLAELDAPVPPEALAEYPVIITGRLQPGGFGTLRFWDRYEKQPERALTVTHPLSLVELARAGLGVGITTDLPLTVFPTDGLRILEVDDAEAYRDVGIYWLRERRLSPAAEALRNAIHAGPRPAGVEPLLGA